MTKNQNYTEKVSQQIFPSELSVPLDDFYKDERGEILNLLLTSITSVARINSKKGVVRANHFHKTDWHYAYVEIGEILYFERSIGSSEIPEPIIYKSGEMFFTKPMVEHAMLFTMDTVLFTFAKNIRSHENHESDVERVLFITPEIIKKYM
jgi:dTDP-4-dehydrorhamnose 3,5-epimerase-like enzyme